MAQTTASQFVSAPKSEVVPVRARDGENAWLWLVKIVTGPLLIIFILIHFIVNHFIGENGLLTYTDVIAYYKNPLIPVMEICFLAAVVTHSLIGLRGIILDLKPSRSALKAIDWLLVIVGVSALSYGAWLALTIASKGA